jgi:hypothetical protein
MGLGPKQIRVLVVDPDSGNGNLSKTKELLLKYKKCREGLGFATGTEPIFTTDFTWCEEKGQDVLSWSPAGFIQDDKDKNLRSYFKHDNLKNNRTSELKALGDLCDLLYTQPELDLPWDQGFCGRPSVGAPVMAQMKFEVSKDPWQSLISELRSACQSAGPARVFIVGSVFGGTGAAGFPAIARILRNLAADKQSGWGNPKNLYIGGAPILPYFSYIVPPGAEEEAKKVFARPDYFLVNTAAALDYYAKQWTGGSHYDALYLLGNQELDMKGQKEFAPGSDTQRNAPHFIETFAALAACEFLSGWRPVEDKRELSQYQVGRQEIDSVGWFDVPRPGIRSASLVFATFAYGFLGFYDHLLNERLELWRKFLPWYLDKFPHEDELNSTEAQGQRTILREYLDTYLHWLRDIHRTTSRRIRLVNRAALGLPETDVKPNFSSLLDDTQFRALRAMGEHPEDAYTPRQAHGYDDIWERLCQHSAKGRVDLPIQKATSMGRFAYLLYQACEKFVLDNYGMKKGE